MGNLDPGLILAPEDVMFKGAEQRRRGRFLAVMCSTAMASCRRRRSRRPGPWLTMFTK